MRTSVLQAVNSTLAVVERDSSLLELQKNVLRRESSLQLNGVFLNDRASRIQEGINYCAVDVVAPIMCGFFDCVTGYQKSPLATISHVVYSTLMSRAVSGSWKRV